MAQKKASEGRKPSNPNGRRRYYDEGKKSPVNMTLTERATELLDAKAAELKLTRSELVERIARMVIPQMTEAQILGEPQGSLQTTA